MLAVAREINLCGARLAGLDLRRLDFSGSRLDRADMRGCDLRGSSLARYIDAGLCAVVLHRSSIAAYAYSVCLHTSASAVKLTENALPSLQIDD
jgi:uncharacterized protein YjbI with pentapeptide repeats